MKASKLTDESKALHKMFKDGVIDEQTLDDSMQGLALLPPPETALEVFTKEKGLDPYLDVLKDEITTFKASPPPLNTAKGRALYGSMAMKVSRLKTALDGMGKDLVDELKDKPKKVDAERKRIRDLLDQWRDDVKQPVVDWQAEQDAIEAKRIADEAAKALAIQIESDHEIALLMYAEHLRKVEEQKLAEIASQLAYEALIAQQAQERATKLAEEAAAKQILDAQLAAERAVREKLEAQARELKIIADAEIAKQAAIEKAERDRLQAIADEREKVAAETKRLADIVAAEELAIAKQAANKNHQKKINNEALDDLVGLGCTPELAKTIVIALANKSVRNVSINY